MVIHSSATRIFVICLRAGAVAEQDRLRGGTNQTSLVRKDKVVADIAVFIVWDEVRQGRERRALRVLAAAREYFEGLEKSGAVESAVVGIVRPAAPTNIGGFFVVRGSQEQLRAVRDSKEFRRLMLRTKLVVEHLRVVRALLGGEFAKHLKELAEEIDDLEK
jgi:hypothetical protein